MKTISVLLFVHFRCEIRHQNTKRKIITKIDELSLANCVHKYWQFFQLKMKREESRKFTCECHAKKQKRKWKRTFFVDILRFFCTSSLAGKFKEQATSNSAWLPVLNSKVPEPRPGTCVNDTSSLPDSVLNFIRSHPLMDRAVNHEHNNPVFYKRDLVFTKLVVDK